ncbi:VCBS repeat-containing protein [Ferruginibacter sp.]|uniref:VCBS repeat-containing protein n=2 Tax=Ferruginibacter sp. TaxID=1940288 RepID=UPI0019871F20|nr:VCBS repeat-containing protein [Ferruginibacter sp.]MBC7628865.1 VCBS repeat-containing protein [Ferruginibacter sp.]
MNTNIDHIIDGYSRLFLQEAGENTSHGLSPVGAAPCQSRNCLSAMHASFSKIAIVICLLIFVSCTQKRALFQLQPSSQTGIHFNNKVEENEKYNVLEYMNIYTGAGVAAGDINNDGLPDLYFSGNQTSGRLYLNKGNFKFEDITEKAGLLINRWCTGVSMVDINGDGLLDIYVNVAGSAKFGDMHNLFYINQGISAAGNVTFKEQAAAYGIADTRQTMNASFFDYDKDGDLDLFLITNPADEMVTGINSIHDRKINGESAGTDILYRNNGPSSTGQITFTDVSREAGILVEGYSLGAAVSDVNGDGWPDIYVSNDFLTNDILYINNGNGTFSDKTAECLKHTSFASMGNDIADFNNDGLPDIYTLDMLPEDNYRKKLIIPPASYDKFQLLLQKGYEPQYTRNALQLNNGNGTFSDISFLSGISSTDWSWSALWADYDNDGDKDLMVTNGFYRDLGNLDYINYQARMHNPMGNQDAKREEKLKAIKNLEKVPMQNYLFENNNDLTFTKRSDDWGFTQKGFSNGACYADLDNDGDLDLIINCFNEEARVYKNNSNEINKNNFLNISLKGRKPNLQGIGSKVWIYTSGKMQFQEFYPYRGYESSVQPIIHFGVGTHTSIDSLKIVWPDGSKQILYNVKTNNALKLDIAHATVTPSSSIKNIKYTTHLFTEITGAKGLNYQHKEPDFDDFKVQPLLPHQFSKNGPGIAVGDVNGDGLEDFFIGGTAASNGSFFFQNKDGSFIKHPLPANTLSDNMGVLLFDADNDNDLDLYIVGGGSESPINSAAYQDEFFENDGKGNFKKVIGALPGLKASGSCVIACDYDHDGDLDLFIGGRISPGSYPLPGRSYLLRNDGTPGKIKFTDVTKEVCPKLADIGMVTSALWTDYDNDGWSDLIITGEFMPITFIKNNMGKNFAPPYTIDNSKGWWNSIVAGDFDNDGDIDYVIGNLGLNSRHKASVKEPLCIYAKDYDKNGLIDPVMCYYVNGKNYIYPTRDEMIKQINSMRGRFPSYQDYASVTFEASFLPEEIKDAYVVKSECFESSYLENKGNGKFVRTALPVEAQFAPVFAMLTGDYNKDGNLDILMAGNSYSTEASTGRYDALQGLLLTGDGKGNFTAVKSAATGFNADNDVKSLAQIEAANGTAVILTGNNNSELKAYQMQTKGMIIIPIKNTDVYAIIQKKNGQSYKQELYYGSNYLSQTSRKLIVSKEVVHITLVDNKGIKREQILK